MVKKSFWLSFLIITALLFSTNISYAAKPIIKSDKQYLDFKTGLYVLKGHVYIEVKDRIITADQARVDMLSMEVWGTGGITLKQNDIFFNGQSVYVYGKKHIAKIDGGVHLSRPLIDITADKVNFNWKNKIATFTGNVKVTKDNHTLTADLLKYNVVTDTILTDKL